MSENPRNGIWGVRLGARLGQAAAVLALSLAAPGAVAAPTDSSGVALAYTPCDQAVVVMVSVFAESTCWSDGEACSGKLLVVIVAVEGGPACSGGTSACEDNLLVVVVAVGVWKNATACEVRLAVDRAY